MAMLSQIGHINLVSQPTYYAYQATYLPTYLTYTYVPNYLPTYLYIPTYLPTYLLYIYIPTYILHKQVCTSKNIGRQACVPTYVLSQVPTYEKNGSSNVVIHINKIEVQGNMLNPFGIILLYKMVWWFDGQDISVDLRRPRFNPPY